MAKGLLTYSFLNCLLLKLCFYHLNLPVASRFPRPNEEPPAWPAGTRNSETEVNPRIHRGCPLYFNYEPAVHPRSIPHSQSDPVNSWAGAAPYYPQTASAQTYDPASHHYPSGHSNVPPTSIRSAPSGVYQPEANRNQDPAPNLPSKKEFEHAVYSVNSSKSRRPRV